MDLLVQSDTDLKYHSEHAAGIDLPAGVGTYDGQHWYIAAGGNAIINTGVKVAIPEGYYGRVVLRSGHGFKQNLTCHVGTVDADYRGEIKIKVFNLNRSPVTIRNGERFAQLIIQPYLKVDIVPVDELPETIRGEAGYGSTGL